MSNFIKIYTGNFVVVQKIIGMMAAQSMSPVIKDEMESARLAGFAASIPFQQEVHVRSDQLDKAVAIVQEALSEIEV